MFDSSQSAVKVIRCIVCPSGCTITATPDQIGNVNFGGYTCKKGLEYAEQEYYEPKRILTTTMRVENGFLPLIPVRTDTPILKDKLKDVLKEIAKIKVQPPIKMGAILISNVLGLDANIIASRDLNKI